MAHLETEVKRLKERVGQLENEVAAGGASYMDGMLLSPAQMGFFDGI